MNKAHIDTRPDTSTDNSSGYRTRWLIAHNVLHDLIHAETPTPNREDLDQRWSRYLAELETADNVAATPA